MIDYKCINNELKENGIAQVASVRPLPFREKSRFYSIYYSPRYEVTYDSEDTITIVDTEFVPKEEEMDIFSIDPVHDFAIEARPKPKKKKAKRSLADALDDSFARFLKKQVKSR